MEHKAIWTNTQTDLVNCTNNNYITTQLLWVGENLTLQENMDSTSISSDNKANHIIKTLIIICSIWNKMEQILIMLHVLHEAQFHLQTGADVQDWNWTDNEMPFFISSKPCF